MMDGCEGHPGSIPWRAGLACGLLLLAWLQLGPLVNGRPADGAWFLFGNDTVSHDVPVQMWMWQAFGDSAGRLPLWMPPLKGGLPTLGAFLWTPYAPSLWLHAVLPFPLAQRLQFVWALWWAGLGGFWLARGLGCRRTTALIAAVGCCLSGHLVTLIHAGHLQKVLALAWLPWFGGGLVRCLAGGHADAARVVRGAAACGVSLGMAFLSGHPQIAYTMCGLLGLRCLWVLPAGGWRRVAPAPAILALGLLVGGAQLLPGSEMAAWSNRSGGVSFEEAVDTSYPPLEVLEFAFPRFLGDSSRAGANEYHGRWGERLVSDYAGLLLVVLALLSLRGLRHEAEGVYWWGAAVLFLLIGFGAHTPLYRLLHAALPGMDRFRSPGTFMAGTALALPVLACLGWQQLSTLAGRWRPSRWMVISSVALFLCVAASVVSHRLDHAAGQLAMGSAARSVGVAAVGCGVLALLAWRGRLTCLGAAAVALLTAVDLAAANSRFLLAVPWDDYQAGYAAPNALDLAMADEPEPRRVFEPGRELSLRPVLNGRDALLAYHPISFALYEEQLRVLTFGTPEWRAAWGVTHVWMPGPADAPVPEGAELAARLFGPPGGVLLRDPAVAGAVRLAGGSSLPTWSWRVRSANEAVLEFSLDRPGTIEVAETETPGWRWRMGDGPWNPVEAVALVRRVDVPAGNGSITWRYAPRSHAVGLGCTALGLLLAGFGGSLSRRRRDLPSPRRAAGETDENPLAADPS